MLRIVCKRRTACRPNACCSESLFAYAPTLRLVRKRVVCRIGKFERITVVSNRNSVWERINIAVSLNGDIVWRHSKRQSISKTIKTFTFRKSAYRQLAYALMLRIVCERRAACRPNACCGESPFVYCQLADSRVCSSSNDCAIQIHYGRCIICAGAYSLCSSVPCKTCIVKM